jgi:hypothetical protein
VEAVGPNLCYYSSIWLEGLRNAAKNPSNDNGSSGLVLNLGRPECEGGMLSIRQRCSVSGVNLYMYM